MRIKTCSIFAILYIFGASLACAYALPQEPAARPLQPLSVPTINLDWNQVLNNLSSPFQDFSQSLQSAANTPIDQLTPSTTAPQVVANGAQGLWNRFDTWCYGLLKFHPAAVADVAVRFFALIIQCFRAIFHFLVGIFGR
ncbi:MAG: hypothetical protein KGJ13_05120 [Patescibacteria group bacterium]|nr:hypothetical protein [Patescibacteria group bacterium]